MIKALFLPLFFSSILATSLFQNAYANFYGAHLCGDPHFKCRKVYRGDTWARLFPSKRDQEIVKRLNRTNLPIRYRSWIVIPKNLNRMNHLDLSPFPKQKNTDGKKLLLVDLSKHAFAAYDAHGELVHWGPVSGGKDYCQSVGRSCRTVTGNFRIYRKQGEECISSKYPLETNGGAPMPYCMHFYKGYALHGSTLPGYHDSHGCVRVFFDDAKWLSHHFMDIGTPIVVMQ